MKIQIVSFTFPPTPGVGGRRWVKFAKYLHREGLDIRVVSAKNQQRQTSQWMKDLGEVNNKVTYIDSKYPRHLGFYESGILHKIRYRLGKWKSMQKTKGNYYDKSIHWLQSLKQQVRSNYNEGYKTVIVSVAPFHSALAISELKQELDDMKLIIDFRDPWTKNRTAYGFDGLSKNRQEFEKDAEKRVINRADLVVSVSEEMNDHFRSICDSNTQFSVIPNGYDPDDLPEIDSKKKVSSGRFVFTGTLYDKSLHQFMVLINALDELKKNEPDSYKKLKFDFYGSVPKEALEYFDNHDSLSFHGKVTLDRVYQEINDAAGCMLFLSDDLNYSFSTKFYEYLALKKPILLFAKPGRTAAFIEEQKIGRRLSNENAIDTLKTIANNQYGFDFNESNAEMALKRASVQNLSKEWVEIIDG